MKTFKAKLENFLCLRQFSKFCILFLIETNCFINFQRLVFSNTDTFLCIYDINMV